jgi:hypothetical protein
MTESTFDVDGFADDCRACGSCEQELIPSLR